VLKEMLAEKAAEQEEKEKKRALPQKKK